MTIIEKILARASGRSKVHANDYVTAKIDMALMPGNLHRLPELFAAAGIDDRDVKVWDQDKFVLVLDHGVPATTPVLAKNHKLTREAARKYKIKNFFDAYCGIGHQILHEKGFVRPGELIVGADSHTTTHGALNAAATGIGISEMAYVFVTGELWFKIPETIKIEITGKLPDLVYSKDIMLYLAGKYSPEMAQYKAIEWTGPVIDDMSLDGRMTMANMSVEIGAKFGVFKADQKTIDYVKSRTDKPFDPVESDPDAAYAETFTLNGTEIEPQVAFPHNVGNVKPISESRGIKINQAYIASCCHGRIEDIEIAASLIKGKKVHPDVGFYIAPASWEIYKQAMDKGLLNILIDAGVQIGNPSCGFCTGFQGVLAPGEKCIAATPRNFQGRMGSPEAEIYLASPASVTAAAIAGEIVDPREVK